MGPLGFGSSGAGFMVHQTTTISAAAALDLVANPVLVMPPPGFGFVLQPFRLVLHKAAGAAYVVGTNDIIVGFYHGAKSPILYCEVSPATIGVGKFLDATFEATVVANGPSFSWTGASQLQFLLSSVAPTTDSHENEGLYLWSTPADLTTGDCVLTATVYANVFPVRP